jgi:hypothetical protein
VVVGVDTEGVDVDEATETTVAGNVIAVVVDDAVLIMSWNTV